MLIPEIFRHYDIRGVAGKDMDKDPEEENREKTLRQSTDQPLLTSNMAYVIIKSSAMKPIKWVLTLLLGSISAQAIVNQDIGWLVRMESYFLGALLLLFLFSYVFLLIVDRESLRSERKFRIK